MESAEVFVSILTPAVLSPRTHYYNVNVMHFNSKYIRLHNYFLPAYSAFFLLSSVFKLLWVLLILKTRQDLVSVTKKDMKTMIKCYDYALSCNFI